MSSHQSHEEWEMAIDLYQAGKFKEAEPIFKREAEALLAKGPCVNGSDRSQLLRISEDFSWRLRIGAVRSPPGTGAVSDSKLHQPA